MNVLIPTALYSYTQSNQVEATGSTLDEVLLDLERQYPGIRFRMIDEQQRVRRHMRIFVNGITVDNLSLPMRPGDEVVIVQESDELILNNFYVAKISSIHIVTFKTKTNS
jgi:molybdopterin synthase sulfur carrier subunit